MIRPTYKLSYRELCSLRVLFRSYINYSGEEPSGDLKDLYDFVCSRVNFQDYRKAMDRFYKLD